MAGDLTALISFVLLSRAPATTLPRRRHANQWRYLAESCVQAAPSLLQHLSLPEAVQSAAA